MTQAVDKPILDSLERTALRNQEKTIAKDEEAFIRVGTALMVIRDGNLYRETHKSFGAYCKGRWEFSKSHAYRMIDGATVINKLGGIGDSGDKVSPMGDVLPTNERQTRPLTIIDLDQVVDVWQEVVKKAPKDDDGNPHITGKHVQETVKQWGNPSDPEEDPPKQPTGKKKKTTKKSAKKGYYGKCPNCAGTKWTEDEDGVVCAKCHHPHGEPAGDADEDRVKTQRQKTVKTAEALLRAFDDLQTIRAKPKYDESIRLCKQLVKTAKGWK